jgi:hypothetical protein
MKEFLDPRWGGEMELMIEKFSEIRFWEFATFSSNTTTFCL